MDPRIDVVSVPREEEKEREREREREEGGMTEKG